jgi:hypothetical protein
VDGFLLVHCRFTQHFFSCGSAFALGYKQVLCTRCLNLLDTEICVFPKNFFCIPILLLHRRCVLGNAPIVLVFRGV